MTILLTSIIYDYIIEGEDVFELRKVARLQLVLKDNKSVMIAAL